jgi:hypothetical protein
MPPVFGASPSRLRVIRGVGDGGSMRRVRPSYGPLVPAEACGLADDEMCLLPAETPGGPGVDGSPIARWHTHPRRTSHARFPRRAIAGSAIPETKLGMSRFDARGDSSSAAARGPAREHPGRGVLARRPTSRLSPGRALGAEPILSIGTGDDVDAAVGLDVGERGVATTFLGVEPGDRVGDLVALIVPGAPLACPGRDRP